MLEILEMKLEDSEQLCKFWFKIITHQLKNKNKNKNSPMYFFQLVLYKYSYTQQHLVMK